MEWIAGIILGLLAGFAAGMIFAGRKKKEQEYYDAALVVSSEGAQLQFAEDGNLASLIEKGEALVKVVLLNEEE